MDYAELARRVDKHVETIQRAYSEMDNLCKRLGDMLKDLTDAEVAEMMRMLEIASSREWSVKSHFYSIQQDRAKEKEAQDTVST